MKPPVSLITVALVLSTAVAVRAADDDNPTFDTPEAAAADPDFALQGEYAGALKTDSGDKKVGVQVIALGDGRFRAVGYMGGLPGAGWDGEEKNEVEATAEEGKVVFTKPDSDVRGVLADGRLDVVAGDGTTIGTLEKVERKSPTLGKKAPEGAIVLFDGTSADAWQNGRLTDDGLLVQGATSKQTFGDHTLHIEFRLPFKPKARGQGRGNSGLYLQGRHEIQMLDSFGLAGENNECGGIYSVKKPDVNMCLPPLAWQTYDVEFTAAKFDADGKKTANARMTVHHNGVKIHDNVEIPKSTTAAPTGEGADKGPIFLQDHGNPVHYRNIWVVEN